VIASPKRVLVVEDDPDVRRLLRQELSAEGFDVLTAVDGIHALRLFSIGHPDVVILDFGLPGLSGPELAARWREGGDGPAIIGLSGIPEAKTEAERLQLDAFVAKPFDVNELLREVRAHLH
jgi:two-component system KDP operon response regulator KdpE